MFNIVDIAAQTHPAIYLQISDFIEKLLIIKIGGDHHLRGPDRCLHHAVKLIVRLAAEIAYIRLIVVYAVTFANILPHVKVVLQAELPMDIGQVRDPGIIHVDQEFDQIKKLLFPIPVDPMRVE